MSGRPWTHDEDAALRRLYPSQPCADIANTLGRSIRATYGRAAMLGIKKSPEYLASVASGRLRSGRQTDAMKAARFQPGHTTWNKGRKGWTAGGRSAETRFKPGRLPHQSRNYRPIGSLRITKYGALQRKVTDDISVAPSLRWVAVSRLVWEAANGPAPDGHIAVFKPGMATTVASDITLDRLELITRAELMRRNSVHSRYPPELARVVQLRGALIRSINRIARNRHANP